MKTAGELAFERYLQGQGITTFEFEKVRAGKRRRPDYSLPGEPECLFDVKDNDHEVRPDGVYDPYPWIREQIEQGRRKFKEFKDACCSVIMYAANAWWFSFMAPEFVFGAMYGDFGVEYDVTDTAAGPVLGESREVFLNGGKVIRRHWQRPQNTTLSALLMLRPIAVGHMRLRKIAEETQNASLLFDRQAQKRCGFDIFQTELGVAVYENSFARIPLPPALFRGPFDERWGEDEHGRLRRLFIGDGLQP
jgi:hypothetical protein